MVKVKEPYDDISKAFEGGDLNHKSEMVETISEYYEVFLEPTKLPPKRDIQHEIQLQRDVPLTNMACTRCM